MKCLWRHVVTATQDTRRQPQREGERRAPGGSHVRHHAGAASAPGARCPDTLTRGCGPVARDCRRTRRSRSSVMTCQSSGIGARRRSSRALRKTSQPPATRCGRWSDVATRRSCAVSRGAARRACPRRRSTRRGCASQTSHATPRSSVTLRIPSTFAIAYPSSVRWTCCCRCCANAVGEPPRRQGVEVLRTSVTGPRPASERQGGSRLTR